MGEWKECKIGDVVSLSQGLAMNKQSKHLIKEVGLPLLRITDMFYDTYAQFIDADNTPNQCIAKSDDIIYTRTGQVGYVFTNKIGVIHNNCFKVKPKPSIDKDFLYWFLKQPSIKDLANSIASGSVQLDLPHNAFKSIEIKFPIDLNEQKNIAGVLKSLDDKIDLLQRQNATLEKMAETLFRKWFVEEAKEEWMEVKITNLFEIRDGTHDSPKQKMFGKKLITSKHLSPNEIEFGSAYFISDEDFENVNKRSKVEKDDILFSMIGTIGIIYLEQSEKIDYAIKNIGLFKTSQNPKWKYFTFLWLKSELGQEFIHEHRSGSTQEYISLGSMRSIVFVVPKENLLEEFNNSIFPFFEKIKTNQIQIRTLIKLRDTLLPKLMSGEVRVQS